MPPSLTPTWCRCCSKAIRGRLPIGRERGERPLVVPLHLFAVNVSPRVLDLHAPPDPVPFENPIQIVFRFVPRLPLKCPYRWAMHPESFPRRRDCKQGFCVVPNSSCHFWIGVRFNLLHDRRRGPFRVAVSL